MMLLVATTCPPVDTGVRVCELDKEASEVEEADDTAVAPDSWDDRVWWRVPPGYEFIVLARIWTGAVCVLERVPGPCEAISIVETDMNERPRKCRLFPSDCGLTGRVWRLRIHCLFALVDLIQSYLTRLEMWGSKAGFTVPTWTSLCGEVVRNNSRYCTMR